MALDSGQFRQVEVLVHGAAWHALTGSSEA
jgi:hypothetical protein